MEHRTDSTSTRYNAPGVEDVADAVEKVDAWVESQRKTRDNILPMAPGESSHS